MISKEDLLNKGYEIDDSGTHWVLKDFPYAVQEPYVYRDIFLPGAAPYVELVESIFYDTQDKKFPADVTEISFLQEPADQDRYFYGLFVPKVLTSAYYLVRDDSGDITNPFFELDVISKKVYFPSNYGGDLTVLFFGDETPTVLTPYGELPSNIYRAWIQLDGTYSWQPGTHLNAYYESSYAIHKFKLPNQFGVKKYSVGWYHPFCIPFVENPSGTSRIRGLTTNQVCVPLCWSPWPEELYPTLVIDEPGSRKQFTYDYTYTIIQTATPEDEETVREDPPSHRIFFNYHSPLGHTMLEDGTFSPFGIQILEKNNPFLRKIYWDCSVIDFSIRPDQVPVIHLLLRGLRIPRETYREDFTNHILILEDYTSFEHLVDLDLTIFGNLSQLILDITSIWNSLFIPDFFPKISSSWKIFPLLKIPIPLHWHRPEVFPRVPGVWWDKDRNLVFDLDPRRPYKSGPPPELTYDTTSLSAILYTDTEIFLDGKTFISDNLRMDLGNSLLTLLKKAVIKCTED